MGGTRYTNLKNCVYRFINEKEEVIYIGKAKDLDRRLLTHNHLPKECYDETAYIDYVSFDTIDDMDFAERYFIMKFNPKYNIILSSRHIGFNCTELDELEFNIYKATEYIWSKIHNQICDLEKESLHVYMDINIFEFTGYLFLINKKIDSLNDNLDRYGKKLKELKLSLENKYKLFDFQISTKSSDNSRIYYKTYNDKDKIVCLYVNYKVKFLNTMDYETINLVVIHLKND